MGGVLLIWAKVYGTKRPQPEFRTNETCVTVTTVNVMNAGYITNSTAKESRYARTHPQEKTTRVTEFRRTDRPHRLRAKIGPVGVRSIFCSV